MRTWLLAGALALAGIPGAAQAQAPEAAPATLPIVGGWSDVANPADDAEVREAAEIATNLLARPARLAKIEAASRQVVAGMNYRLRLALRDGSRWDVTVYRSLAGDWRMTEQHGLARVKAAAPVQGKRGAKKARKA